MEEFRPYEIVPADEVPQLIVYFGADKRFAVPWASHVNSFYGQHTFSIIFRAHKVDIILKPKKEKVEQEVEAIWDALESYQLKRVQNHPDLGFTVRVYVLERDPEGGESWAEL